MSKSPIITLIINSLGLFLFVLYMVLNLKISILQRYKKINKNTTTNILFCGLLLIVVNGAVCCMCSDIMIFLWGGLRITREAPKNEPCV